MYKIIMVKFFSLEVYQDGIDVHYLLACVFVRLYFCCNLGELFVYEACYVYSHLFSFLMTRTKQNPLSRNCTFILLSR
jgi:hypothetical protein